MIKTTDRRRIALQIVDVSDEYENVDRCTCGANMAAEDAHCYECHAEQAGDAPFDCNNCAEAAFDRDLDFRFDAMREDALTEAYG